MARTIWRNGAGLAVCLLFAWPGSIAVADAAASEPPVEGPEDIVLRSADDAVEITIRPRFGGAIAGVVDHLHAPDRNLVAGEHGGAAIQSAFWIQPRHDDPPPGCPSERSDMWYANPTQGGYYADVMSGRHLGNPIGVFGNGPDASADPGEGVRVDRDGRRVRFRSRFIRHDYCAHPVADPENRALWDTQFYLSQSIEFTRAHPHALRIRGRIEYVGPEPAMVGTRQLPIVFGRHVPSICYRRDGERVVLDRPSGEPVNPDSMWAAIVDAAGTHGIGMVFAPATTFHDFGNPPKGMFGYGLVDGVSRLFPSSTGAPDLDTMGRCRGVDRGPGNLWRFQSGGAFDWTVYLVVDSVDAIETTAAALLADPDAWDDHDVP